VLVSKIKLKDDRQACNKHTVCHLTRYAEQQIGDITTEMVIEFREQCGVNATPCTQKHRRGTKVYLTMRKRRLLYKLKIN